MLYEDICCRLAAQIDDGTIPEGSFLPTVQSLCKRYQVSHITILRVFEELKKLGKVTKPGKRYVAAAAANTGFRPVTGIICPVFRQIIPGNPGDNYGNEVNCGIIEAASELNFSLLQIPHTSLLLAGALNSRGEFETAPLLYSAIAAAPLCDGYIFDARVPDDALAQILRRTGKPAVVIGRKSALDIDCILPPNREAVRMLCETTQRYGYRKYLFIRYTDNSFNAEEREQEFLAFAEKLPENAWGIADDWTTIPQKMMLPKLQREFDRLKAKDEPVAVLCASDRFLESAQELLESHGARLHRDFGLAAVGGIYRIATHKPPYTYAAINMLEMGKLAVQQLAQRIRGLASPGILLRGSTAFVNGSSL